MIPLPGKPTEDELRKIGTPAALKMADELERERLAGRGRQRTNGSQALLVADTGFDPNQPRDRRGQWRKVGGGGLGVSYNPVELSGQAPKQSVIDGAARAIGKVAKLPGGPTVMHMDFTPAPGGMLRGRYNGESRRISLANPRPGEDPRLPNGIPDSEQVETLIHETGHWLDYEEGALGYQNRRVPASVESTPDFKLLMDAIRSSPPIQRLVNRKAANTPAQGPPGKEWEWADYELIPTETFARAWEQYVMTEANTKPDAPAMKEARESVEGVEDWFWTKEEFEPVAAAFGELIKTKGWQPNGKSQ